MSELFPEASTDSPGLHLPPLADRMRPLSIDEVIGQSHLIGKEGPLRLFFETGDFPSMIFWGPPGVGKTTLALLIANYANYNFVRLSAIDSGVKDLRQVISNAERLLRNGRKSLLFIDEIHRFNKAQQDALLHAVESGIITLIGATTENPSFEVISALLSRCQVYRLQLLSDEEIRLVINRAIENDKYLKNLNVRIESWEFLLTVSAGDARSALNAIDLAIRYSAKSGSREVNIDAKLLQKALQQKTANYDKQGEAHYDTISAFIKSLRGSDPDAALFWLAKMLDAGEDPKFIARRMVVFASEDIGNADPFALSIAVSVFQAVDFIGMPECRINLAQGVTYLASCQKSNASYIAISRAEEDVKNGAPLTVPMHIRNAPTSLMKKEGYGAGYRYPHDFDGHFVEENYFPVGMEPKIYYEPGEFGREEFFRKRLRQIWSKRYRSEK